MKQDQKEQKEILIKQYKYYNLNLTYHENKKEIKV